MSLEVAQERHKNVGRNDACPCESGKKYKKCHHAEDAQTISTELKRVADAAEAEAAAKLAAEEAENEKTGDSTSSKDGAKSKATSGSGKRTGKSGAQGAGRGGKGGNAQSLPRRGAV